MARKKVTRQTVRQSKLSSKEEERERRRARLINIILGAAAVVIVAIGAFVILQVIGTPAEESSAEQSIPQSEESETVSEQPAEESSAEQSIPQTEEGETMSEQQIEKMLGDDRPLAAVGPAERYEYYSAYPEMIIDTSKDYEAILRTENGDIRLKLFDDDAPLTVNSFAFLASQGFYDGLTFHRVIEDFMAQGGDPTGQGFGGPGYQFEDETDNSLTFDRPGLLAMANSGPGTNGSQFFITYVPTPHLNGAHTIFGEMVEGEDVLLALLPPGEGGAAGSQANVIERIDIIELQ
jgi:cyclophilin family peptidyl-prolyl cis-trans isomerase